jgi:hypothetical protein
MSFLTPTSTQKFTRQMQLFAETNGYAAQVTNPTFFSAGLASSIDIGVNVDHEAIRIMGSRKQYSNISMGTETTISITYSLMDTKLLTYGITDPAGTGTLGESLGAVISQKINGTEMFAIARGLVTESVTINFERFPNVQQNFFCPSISDWLTLSQLRTALNIGTTATPSWAAAPTADPWSHLTGTDGASSAVTIDGTSRDITKMTVTVNNNLFKQKPLGYKNVRYVEAGNKVVTVSLEPYMYDNFDIDLVNNYNAVTVVGTLRTATPTVALTVAGCQFDSYSRKNDTGGGGGGGDFETEPIAGTAVDVSVPLV